MAVKFIITGDLHYRIKNPGARQDIYQEALEYKLNEVFELAREHNAAGIIIPGDIFDSTGISIPGMWGLAKALRNSPCPVITIPGNHDTWGHNLETIGRAPYGLLRELDFIRCAYDMPMSVQQTGDIDIHISGHGYNVSTDVDITQYFLPNDAPRGFNIHITHGMLLDKPVIKDAKHTLVDELETFYQHNPQLDPPHVLVNGHYHFGLPIMWAGKTLVINPGALGRLTGHKEEMSREVKVALLTINSEDDYNAQFILLKTARPGHEVLSREHIEAVEARSDRLDTFLQLLGSESEAKFLEVQEIVEGIAKSDNIPGSVVREALDRIGKAREIVEGRAV